jgi:multiple sugar transport system ATP-binding protein
MATVRLEDVDKVYPNGHVAARDLDLEVEDGELLVLVGPSGCGKSTALRMVAGLETPTRGRVMIGDRDVTSVPPQDRDVAMVFQNYALYPHMSVRENLSFGLRMRGVEEPERERRVLSAARALGLTDLLDRKPSQLSGGQRQRVALGRATVREPLVFLFDEPLSNLDAKLRVQTRAELARLHRRFGATMIYVTHDQEEAMTLGQRVAVMNDGRLEQVAPPMEVYRHPATRFVGGFVGSPAMNFFPGRLSRDDGAPLFEGEYLRFRVEEDGSGEGREGGDSDAGNDGDARPVTLGVRPGDLRLVPPGQGDFDSVVDVVEPLGSQVLVHLRPPDAPAEAPADEEALEEIRAVVDPEEVPEVNEQVGARPRRDRLHFFDADSGRRLEPGA